MATRPTTPTALARTALARTALSAAALAASLVLAGCGDPASAASDDLLAAYGLNGLDTRQVIEQLDTTALADRPTDLMASIRPDGLHLATADGELTLPMPAGEFYLSVAPYVAQTHECYFHSLTTCVGELRNEPIDVTITNADTGEVLVDGTEVTYDNGFIGFWVPADISAEITIDHDGRSATEVLPTTSADDRTCVTTLQLT